MKYEANDVNNLFRAIKHLIFNKRTGKDRMGFFLFKDLHIQLLPVHCGIG